MCKNWLKNPIRLGKNVRKPQGIFWLTLNMFSDQYVFRTSGSTHYRCHHIHPSYCHPAFSWQWLCHNIGTGLLQSIWYYSSPHRLKSLLKNLAIPDNTYNWLVQFFRGHSHCTRFGNQTSALREITSSIIQGSAIGPASHVVTSCDLTTTTAGNRVCKYADWRYICYYPCLQLPLSFGWTG